MMLPLDPTSFARRLAGRKVEVKSHLAAGRTGRSGVDRAAEYTTPTIGCRDVAFETQWRAGRYVH
jgi:hypothetical protein